MAHSLGIRIDGVSPVPIYQQIFDQIALRIREGILPGNYRLPPTRVLAQELQTHRNTIVHAYELLEASGFVDSTVGRGTFVRGGRLESRPVSQGDPRGLSWSNLLSVGSRLDPLQRLAAFARTPVPPDAINLQRMQANEECLPHVLFKKCVDHVLRTEGWKTMQYAPREGLPRLRNEIAKDLARQGVPGRAEDIVVTNGSQQAIDLIARTLIDPGDTVVLDQVTYQSAIGIFAMSGAKLVTVQWDSEGPTLESLDRAARSGAKLAYFMPNSHNPTGRSMSQGRRQELVAWSHRHNIAIIEDDYGADLDLDGTPPPSSLRALSSQVIYISTFSKKCAPGLRVGFILCPDELRLPILAVKNTTDLGASMLLQFALAEFLERGYMTAHLSRILPEYRRRRDALDATLARHLPKGFSWHKPSRGVVMWLPLPTPVDPRDVFERAMSKRVMIAPDLIHAVNDQGLERGIRITFCGEPVDRIVLGARRLAEAITESANEAKRVRKPAETMDGV